MSPQLSKHTEVMSTTHCFLKKTAFPRRFLRFKQLLLVIGVCSSWLIQYRNWFLQCFLFFSFFLVFIRICCCKQVFLSFLTPICYKLTLFNWYHWVFFYTALRVSPFFPSISPFLYSFLLFIYKTVSFPVLMLPQVYSSWWLWQASGESAVHWCGLPGGDRRATNPCPCGVCGSALAVPEEPYPPGHGSKGQAPGEGLCVIF